MNFQKLRQGAFGSESVIMRLKIVNPKLGGNPKNREVHQGNSLVIPGLLKARHFIVIKATAFHPWMASKVESCIFYHNEWGVKQTPPDTHCGHLDTKIVAGKRGPFDLFVFFFANR